MMRRDRYAEDNIIGSDACTTDHQNLLIAKSMIIANYERSCTGDVTDD